MELIRGYSHLTPRHHGGAVTIGNFDGVHIGHQAILKSLIETAQTLGIRSTVIIFEPQPQEYFANSSAPPRLTRLREKVRALSQWNLDYLLLLRFNAQLANLSAEAFIQQILVNGLKLRYLTIGDDFRFGKGRSGNFALLQTAGQHHGFEVVPMTTFNVEAERVSSTRIRAALHSGDLAQAESLLGRPYRLCGRVVYGYQRGRSIGFPTANINLHRTVCPVRGVYAVRVLGLASGQPGYGVANIGHRPTIGGTHPLLEVHLFDFTGNLYGHYLQVELLHRIRDEQRFASFAELRQQIQHDAQMARQLLSNPT